MQIIIKYDSCWRNSFLDGNNNEPVPKKGRKYIASKENLENKTNFKPRKIEKDTVMGVLNRLIGDQKKLYQSKDDENYYLGEIENDIKFEDKPQLTQEMTYLRNISGSHDKNSFTGAIKFNHVMFNSNYSQEFWGVLALDIDELIEFVVNDNLSIHKIALDPISISNSLELLKKKKPLAKNKDLVQVLSVFEKSFNSNFQGFFKEDFGKINYFNKKDQVVVISLYATALYLQLARLSKKYDVSTARTKLYKISGVSKRGYTKKDFMDRFTTGKKKKIWGNPYIHETFVKGEGKTKNLMTKASGELTIKINISKEKAKEIRTMIHNAGVSSFYLGKKGLAFVDNITVAEESR